MLRGAGGSRLKGRSARAAHEAEGRGKRGCGGAEPPRPIKGVKRSKTLRRPKAGHQWGCGGGAAPPPAKHYSTSIIIIIIIIIIRIKRPNGEALENFLPAEGRPVGRVRGGQRPPAQHYYYYHY